MLQPCALKIRVVWAPISGWSRPAVETVTALLGCRVRLAEWGPYSTSLGCRRQPSLACHAWNHGKSPKSSPLSQQCRFHCHTWSAGESHYCVNSKGFMKFGTHTNEESDEYQQKWLPLSDFVGLCSKYIAIPYGSMAFILKNPSFQITRCF